MKHEKPNSTVHSETYKQEEWYKLSVKQTAEELSLDTQRGSTALEAQARLQKYGPNVFARKKKESGLHAFLLQYKHPPWHIIPADYKWFARAPIVDILTTSILSLGVKYPVVDDEKLKKIEGARLRLESE